MRTLIISYDLAQPHRNKHVLAQAIMGLGSSWARPLEQTWYVRTEANEDMIEHQLAGHLDPDDGLLIQAVKDDANVSSELKETLKLSPQHERARLAMELLAPSSTRAPARQGDGATR